MARAKPGVSTQNQSSERLKGGRMPDFPKRPKGTRVTRKSK
jgi:hypothetical protein